MSARMNRRRFLHGAGAAALAGLGRPAEAEVGDAGREAVARAATSFLAALDERARRRATFRFADAERANWHYVPRRREGLAVKDMSAGARAAAHALVRAALSALGYAKVVNVMRLEEVLRQTETFGFMLRDPDNYSLSVFGAPGGAGPWGWRLEGHHLSLNFTFVPGRPVVVTPAFLGANPALVGAGPLKGLRTLADEQDLGLAAALAVPAALRARLVIAERSLGDIVSGPGRAESLKGLQGIPLADLPAETRGLVQRLLETYARNMRAEAAEHELRRIHEAGLERLHFAWAGPIDPARPHYYRVHGPTALIEYDNTQPDANHVHSVWHDPVNDFGADLLRAHYHHGHHRHA